MLRMDTILLAILVIWYCGYSSACFYRWLFDFRFLGNRRDLTIDTRQHGSVPDICDNVVFTMRRRMVKLLNNDVVQ